MTEALQAEITGIFGAYYWVRLTEEKIPAGMHPLFFDGGRPVLTAKPSGRLRISEAAGQRERREHLLAIGDQVGVELHPGSGEEIMASIVAVAARRNMVQRGAADRVQTLAANVDLVLVISSFDQPAFNPGFIDRVLCECELARVPAIVVLNKYDLFNKLSEQRRGDILATVEIYRALGYGGLTESFCQGVSTALDELLQKKRVLLLGQSGVGKSTFLNVRAREIIQRTQDISIVNKGRHTTVNPVLYSMPGGEELVDVPGLREFGMQHLQQADIRFGFREFSKISCRFDNCLHRNEPGCGVLEAASKGEVSQRRYKSYLAIVESIKEHFKPRKGDYWRGIRK